MIDNRAVFTKYEDKYVLMHIVGNKAEHIYVYDSLCAMPIGSIINCRVENRAENIGASFVRFDKNDRGFINKLIKPETVLALQYKKEAYDEKKATFTDKLTIEGEYVIAAYGAHHVKVSSKIPESDKSRIAEVFSQILENEDIGVVIRTRAYTEEDGIERAKEELAGIRELFYGINEKSGHVPAYTVLYSPVPDHIKDLLYLSDIGIEEIVTDDEEIRCAIEHSYERISGPVKVTDRVRLRFYDDDLIKLCNLYSFNAKISEALSRKVYLKSGVYITIEQSEALVSVDVNSAGCLLNKNREDTILAINCEAAREVARQLRLRNLSGMVIVDFINMDSKADYDILEDVIRDALSKDRINAGFIDFTGLKLCEIVRRRSGRSLYHSLRG
ncbi:MAG: ribonuclease E/G [Lachnospiraceae bacterium]|nr:ribonuclease E/G [Lachnospiraceae bacterium]